MKIVVTEEDSHQYRMEELFSLARLGYGGIMRGDIKNIVVFSAAGADREGIVSFQRAYFNVGKIIAEGDRNFPLPRKIVFEKFEVSGPGEYSILNAFLTPDDCVWKIIIDESTIVAPAKKDAIQKQS